jgi:hypothetical protein
MAIKNTNISHCKDLQNLPKIGISGLKNILSGNPAPTEQKKGFGLIANFAALIIERSFVLFAF